MIISEPINILSMMTTSVECYKHEMFQNQKIGYPPTSSSLVSFNSYINQNYSSYVTLLFQKFYNLSD